MLCDVIEWSLYAVSCLFKSSFAFFCGQFVHPIFQWSLPATRLLGVFACTVIRHWIQTTLQSSLTLFSFFYLDLENLRVKFAYFCFTPTFNFALVEATSVQSILFWTLFASTNAKFTVSVKQKYNLAKVRITDLSHLADANGFFRSWSPSNTYSSLDPHESAPNGISIDSAAFARLTFIWIYKILCFPMLPNGPHNLQIFSLATEISSLDRPRSHAWFSAPTRVTHPNGISIGSAGFCTGSRTWPTDRHTDHATPSVATGRIACTECMRWDLKSTARSLREINVLVQKWISLELTCIRNISELLADVCSNYFAAIFRINIDGLGHLTHTVIVS